MSQDELKKDDSNIDKYRRNFLAKGTLGVAAATIAPGVMLHSVARAVW